MTSSSTNESKPTIGFIGLGGMGSRMAGRLIDDDFPVIVYNRNWKRAEAMAERGATIAGSPRELAQRSKFVLSSLSDDAAVEAMMFAPDGALAGAKPDTVIIEMSTIYPATSLALHHAAAAKGIAALDAPVSGSLPQAEQGQLVIFVGGDAEAHRQARPILDVLGKESFHMGPAGSGATMKLVVNALLGLGVQALAEAIALGEKSGLDRPRLLEVLGQTAVVSPAQKAKLENARKDDYPPTFPARLMFKDYGLVFRRAAEVLVPMPATAAAQQVCAAERAAQAAAGKDEDFSAVIRQIRGHAGIDRAG